MLLRDWMETNENEWKEASELELRPIKYFFSGEEYFNLTFLELWMPGENKKQINW